MDLKPSYFKLLCIFTISFDLIKQQVSLFLCTKLTLPYFQAYSICFPKVSIGRKHIATKAAKIKAPDTYTGALGFVPEIFAAMIGAHKPPILFKQLAIPVPVPRLGAGKTSGV